jgi:hypothetical protein
VLTLLLLLVVALLLLPLWPLWLLELVVLQGPLCQHQHLLLHYLAPRCHQSQHQHP